MKGNGNDSNKQDGNSQYCQVTIVVLYLKLKEETTCSKTPKYAGPKNEGRE